MTPARRLAGAVAVAALVAGLTTIGAPTASAAEEVITCQGRG